jgi:hypothetical protein
MVYPIVAGVNAQVISRRKADELLGMDWDTIQQEIAEEKAAGFMPMMPGSQYSPEGTLPGMFSLAGLPNPDAAARALLAGVDPAVDQSGDPRHAETHALMKKLREAISGEIAIYRGRLIAAAEHGSQSEADQARAKFILAVWPAFKKLIDEARGMGQKDIPK